MSDINRNRIVNANKTIDVASLLRNPQYSNQVLNQMFEVIVKNIVRETVNTIIQDTSSGLGEKINKDFSAVEDNFATWSNGGLKDSGSKADDFEVAGAVAEHDTDLNAHADLMGDKADAFTIGNGLVLDDGELSVNVVDVMEDDNMNPITSNAVYDVVGDIATILATI